MDVLIPKLKLFDRQDKQIIANLTKYGWVVVTSYDISLVLLYNAR